MYGNWNSCENEMFLIHTAWIMIQSVCMHFFGTAYIYVLNIFNVHYLWIHVKMYVTYGYIYIWASGQGGRKNETGKDDVRDTNLTCDTT